MVANETAVKVAEAVSLETSSAAVEVEAGGHGGTGLLVLLCLLAVASAFGAGAWWRYKRYQGHRRVATTEDDLEQVIRGRSSSSKVPTGKRANGSNGKAPLSATSEKRKVSFHVPSKDELDRSERLVSSVMDPPPQPEPATNAQPTGSATMDRDKNNGGVEMPIQFVDPIGDDIHTGADLEAATLTMDAEESSAGRRNRFGAGLAMDLE